MTSRSLAFVLGRRPRFLQDAHASLPLTHTKPLSSPCLRNSSSLVHHLPDHKDGGVRELLTLSRKVTSICTGIRIPTPEPSSFSFLDPLDLYLLLPFT